MKRLSTFLTLSVITLLVTSFTLKQQATLSVDTGASTLTWTGYHLAKSYSHTGTLAVKSGSLEMSDGELTGGSFVIDMTSLTNSDLEKAKDNAKLVNHLKSDDFFDVDKFPEASLEIKSVNSKGGGKYDVTADLSIRGITKPITFEATQSGSADAPSIAAKLTVERTQFEVMYGWKIENAMLGGEFDLEVNLKTAK